MVSKDKGYLGRLVQLREHPIIVLLSSDMAFREKTKSPLLNTGWFQDRINRRQIMGDKVVTLEP